MSNRYPVSIPVQPWYKDHYFMGKIVFAAVESMALLATEAVRKKPGLNVKVMTGGRFAKFLEIPPEADVLNVLVSCENEVGDQVRMKLLSEVQLASMRRIKEHGELVFSSAAVDSVRLAPVAYPPDLSPLKEIEAQTVYSDYVPFGPSYRTLDGTLFLLSNMAVGKLRAPNLPISDSLQHSIGSPFPMDGAMHAACTLAQQFVDYAPFPVGFDLRHIVRPTQPGQEYLTRVDLISRSEDQLELDFIIYSPEGELFEVINGLCMRDVRKALG